MKSETTDMMPETGNLADLSGLDIAVEKYSDKTWAVNVNGELLCVTAYRKGTYAVRDMLTSLWKRISELAGRLILREVPEQESTDHQGPIVW